MRLFGRGTNPSGSQLMAYAEISQGLDTALTAIFTEEGKRAVLYYLSQKHSLSLEQASKNPKKLESALTSLLGEVGWAVVKKKIVDQLSIRMNERSTLKLETTSLTEVFGMVSGIGRAFVSPIG